MRRIFLLVALAACASSEAQVERTDSLQARLGALEAAMNKRAADSIAAANKRIADSIEAERTRPRVLALMPADTIVVPPEGPKPGLWSFPFRLAKRGECRVTGRIRTVSGGNLDVAVALMTEDQFVNWRNTPREGAPVLFWAGPQTITTIDRPVSDSGAYRLVLSNRFSTFTSKHVVGNAEIRCVGSPQPEAVQASD